MYPEHIIEICNTISNMTFSKTKNPEILEKRDLVVSATKFLDDSLSEVIMTNRIYCVKNNIHSVPTCKTCESHCGFFAADNNKGFNEYCSQDCRQHSTGNPPGVDEKLSNYEWMFEHRITKRMSSRSIGEMLGISEFPVMKWSKKHNLPDTKYNASPEQITELLDNYELLFNKYKIDKLTLKQIADEFGTSQSSVQIAITRHGIEANDPNEYERTRTWQSAGELELIEFIKTLYSGELVTGNKSVLGDTRELDVYLPELNLAFEYNGVYRHRYIPDGDTYAKKKDSTYHKSKTDKCADKGIGLTQIWSSSWLTKKDIWKSRIRAKFGIIPIKIHARKCIIKEISTGEKNTFLDFNHLQGRDKCTVKLGLFFNDELVSVMTFGPSRYDKNINWELVRFATKLDTLVVGGFSKLLKYFKSNNIGSIVSYADRMHSNGNVYEKNGFIVHKENPAAYHYFKKNTETLLNRQNFYKSKIKNVPDDVRTEFEIMTDNGYHRIYDCGTITYIMR